MGILFFSIFNMMMNLNRFSKPFRQFYLHQKEIAEVSVKVMIEQSLKTLEDGI
jgi:hypothetical protein